MKCGVWKLSYKYYVACRGTGGKSILDIWGGEDQNLVKVS